MHTTPHHTTPHHTTPQAFWCCGKKTALDINASDQFKKVHRFVLGAAFEAITVCAIVGNTIVLMMDIYPIAFEDAFGRDDGVVSRRSLQNAKCTV